MLLIAPPAAAFPPVRVRFFRLRLLPAPETLKRRVVPPPLRVIFPPPSMVVFCARPMTF